MATDVWPTVMRVRRFRSINTTWTLCDLDLPALHQLLQKQDERLLTSFRTILLGFPSVKPEAFRRHLSSSGFFFSHFYYFTFVHFTVDNNFARTKLTDFQMSLEKSIKVCLKFNVDFVCLFWLGVTSQLIKIHQFRTLMFIWNSSLRNDSCMTAIDSNYLSSVVAGSILFFVRFFFLSCFIVGVIFLIRLMRVWRDGKVKWPFVISEVALSVEPDCKVQ